MSTTNPVRPQGPIVSGSRILLTTIINNRVYVMVRSGTNGVEMVQALNDSCQFNTNVEANLLQFTVSSRGEVLIFSVVSSSGQFLGYNSVTGLLQLTSNQQVIFFNQPNFQDFERPSILLSGVQYIPYSDATTGMRLVVTVNGQPTAVTLIPVPINYFTMCAAPEGNTPSNNPLQALQLIQCSYASTCCTGLPNAWTTQQDCFNNNVFTYCTAGTFCTGNCQSECQSPTETCVFATDPAGNSMYTCQSTTPEVVTPAVINAVPVSDSGWIVGLIIFVIILLIGLLIFAYYMSTPDDVHYTHEVHHDVRTIQAPVGTVPPGVYV